MTASPWREPEANFQNDNLSHFLSVSCHAICFIMSIASFLILVLAELRYFLGIFAFESTND